MKQKLAKNGTLARAIQDWRAAGEFSQEEAARKLGVPPGTIRNWEQKRYQPGRVVERLLKQEMSRNIAA